MSNNNINNINTSINNNNNKKLSITKITLKSSSDKNHTITTSPKIISLSINNNINNPILH